MLTRNPFDNNHDQKWGLCEVNPVLKISSELDVAIFWPFPNTKITGKWLVHIQKVHQHHISLFFESKTVLCTAGPQSMYMGGDLGGTIHDFSSCQDFIVIFGHRRWWSTVPRNDLMYWPCAKGFLLWFCPSHFSILSPPQPGFSLYRWAQVWSLEILEAIW